MLTNLFTSAFLQTVISSLSKVVYNILLPALLVVNVARTVYSKPLVSPCAHDARPCVLLPHALV